jgi:hypothetical protein
MAPRFSIVVPTRERVETLIPCLKSCLAQNHANFEVVVMDNASNDDTEQAVRTVGDQRLVYRRQPNRVSMRVNFESAVAAARGDYILMIGDDDGVVPGALARLDRVVSEHPVDFVTWPFLHYLWPGATEPTYGHLDVARRFSFRPMAPAKLSDMQAALTRGDHIDTHRVPKIYHGCVSRALLDTLRAKAGEVFSYDNPDIYLQIALILMAESGITLGHWVTINGGSKRSNGIAWQGRTASGSTSKGSEFDRFNEETQIGPQCDVPHNPAFFDIDYFRYASVVTAAKKFQHPISISHDAWGGRIAAQIARSPRDAASALAAKRFSHVDEAILSRLKALTISAEEPSKRSKRKSVRSQIRLRTADAEEDDVFVACQLLTEGNANDFVDKPRGPIQIGEQLLRWSRFVFQNRSRLA